MKWKTGAFDRSRVSSVFHNFVPAHAANNLQEVSLQDLQDRGKRLILLDVDHTLVKWKQEDFAEEVLAWIADAKARGFDLCIISNTRRVERLKRLSEKLGVATVRGRFKPSRAMFRLALIKFKRKTEEAIMIGDQLMTDILGANRSGIEAIWVAKMEGKEFGPTKINRFIEGLLKSAIYKAIVTAPDAHPAPASVEQSLPASDKTLVKQIIRFGIVGGSSFIIDAGLTYILMHWVRVGGGQLSETLGSWLRSSMPGVFSFAHDNQGAAAPILGGVASFVAMFNSFVWNRMWTFEAKGKEKRLAQLHRFYLVSILGAVINSFIFSLFFNGLFASSGHRTLYAKALSALIVAVWNFTGQRLYAFRSKDA